MRNDDLHLKDLPYYGFIIGVQAVLIGNLPITNILMLGVIAKVVLPKRSEGFNAMAYTAARASIKMGKWVICGVIASAAWNHREEDKSDHLQHQF